MKKLREHRGIILAALAIALTYVAIYVLGIGCPIKFASGISCPGCGMTRATLALLRLDLRAARYFHPAVFLMPPLGVLFVVFYLKKMRRALTVWTAVFISVLIVTYIVRLALGSEIVTFSPEEGLLPRIFKYVFQRN